MSDRLCKTLWYAVLLVAFSLTTALAQTSPNGAPAAPASKSLGTLTGRVLDPDGEPLPDVEVVVRGRGGLRQFSQNTKTDDDGNFKFTGLPAQQYRLLCQGNGIYVPAASKQTAWHYLGEQVTLNLVKGGVITGRVTDAFGEPLIGIGVYVERLGDSTGDIVSDTERRPRLTDDRGIYRVFGLEPGVYVIHVKGQSEIPGPAGMQSNEVSTYYPSGVRATASKITVQSGAEISGIDLQHAGRLGRTVSGTVTGARKAEIEMPISLTALGLYNPTSQQLEYTTASVNGDGFAFQGVSDGEYDVLAVGPSLRDNSMFATPVRVKVSGADVSGIKLRLTPLGSVSGRLIHEPAACRKDELVFEEVGITAQSVVADLYQREMVGGLLRELQSFTGDMPESTGTFTLRNLMAGRQFLQFSLPPGWFVKAAKQPAAPATPAAKQPSDLDVGRLGFVLKAGEQLKGLTVTLAGGAASLSGTLESKTPLPATLRVHLIPADATQADELLRYDEAVVESGRFAFANLAPGKYWLLAQPHDERAGKAAWHEQTRLKLRKAAEAAAQVIELKACQDVRDARLPFAAQ